MIVKSQCIVCARVREIKIRVNGIDPVVHVTCEAYPHGVPEPIATNRRSHMRAAAMDNGLKFVPSPDATEQEITFHTEIRPGT